jgi:3-dehydroquinate dehydratase
MKENNDALVFTLLNLLAHTHGCTLVDIDIESRTVKFKGPEKASGELVLALHELMG